MKEILGAIGAVLVIALVVFGAAILASLAGAFTGWCVEKTFLADFVISGFKYVGVEVARENFPAVGAMLGFVGSFFRSSATHNKE